MKGTPQFPQCGFSRAVVQVLDLHGVQPDKMATYNVLEDQELRNSIKEFSCVYSLDTQCEYILDLGVVATGQPSHNSTSAASSSVDATSY